MKLPFNIGSGPIQANFDALVRQLGGRIVHGIIDTVSPGAIVAGSGFSITFNAAGDVTVTFDVPFSEVPAVVTDCATTGTFDTRLNAAATATGFRVQVFNTSTGALAGDSHVTFHAIGN